jgi:asparagine synthetase B (glutamine-hydrolysing)
MCGICGKLNFDHNAGVEPTLIRAMMDTIRYRGRQEHATQLSPGGLYALVIEGSDKTRSSACKS